MKYHLIIKADYEWKMGSASSAMVEYVNIEWEELQARLVLAKHYLKEGKDLEIIIKSVTN